MKMMTYQTLRVLTPFSRVLAWIDGVLAREAASMRTGLARRQIYRTTYCALQSQSDSELAKQGVARGQIATLAHQKALSAAL